MGLASALLKVLKGVTSSGHSGLNCWDHRDCPRCWTTVLPFVSCAHTSSREPQRSSQIRSAQSWPEALSTGSCPPQQARLQPCSAAHFRQTRRSAERGAPARGWGVVTPRLLLFESSGSSLTAASDLHVSAGFFSEAGSSRSLSWDTLRPPWALFYSFGGRLFQ